MNRKRTGISRRTRALALLTSLAAGMVWSAPVPAQDDEQPELEIVRVTPLHGAAMDRGKIPVNIQSATAEELRAQQAADLSEYMNRNFASVFVNETQSNPLQPDVQFRGFVASPLLGLPQGLAVYQNGVRVNEPFGDTVNWVLIPESAISTIDLVSGSHPLFGLNTLGGAIAVETKTGFTDPGVRAEVSGGSWSRLITEAESGGTFGERDNFGYYVNGWYFDEEGWRDFSPSQAGRFFANLGWQSETATYDADFTYVDTDLIGNGPAPVQLQAVSREAVFTRPDITENQLAMMSVRGSKALSPTANLDWSAYYRNSDISTFNGDDSDFEACELPENEGFICRSEEEEEGEEARVAALGEPGEEVVLDPGGVPIPAIEETEGATVNRTSTGQDSYGASLQLTVENQLGERSNQFIAGATIDQSDVDFVASTELGMLDETRLALPSGFFVGGAFTELEAETQSYSLFFTNTYSFSDALALTVSGRYNRTGVELRDQLGTALNGDHDFDRFNPAVGITYRFSPVAQFYAGYYESNRAPSPVELTCADEDDPCRLPNAFVADPPLEQVVAKTYEAGLRGIANGVSWRVGLFDATNEDDIIFISAGALTNQGFFDNVGESRRRGAELSFEGRYGERLDWFFNYTRLEAEFREDFFVASPNHPLAEDGEIMVASGDRLPGIPEDLAKAGFSVTVLPRFTLGGDVTHSGDRVLRGDEANLLPEVSDFTVVNLRGEFRFSEHGAVFAKVDNVFDRQYETIGLFGEPDEVLGDEFDDPRFLAPGAPRAAWIGVRLGL